MDALPWQNGSNSSRRKWVYLAVVLVAIALVVLGLRSGPAVEPASVIPDNADEAKGLPKNIDNDADVLENVPEAVDSDADVPASGATTATAERPVKYDLEGFLFDSLTMDECKAEFPKIFFDVDQRVAFWNKRQHKITANDTNMDFRNRDMESGGGGAMRLLIHDNELRILQSTKDNMGHMGMRPRSIAILGLLQRAIDSSIAAGEQLPTIEVGTCVEDVCAMPDQEGTSSFWAFAASTDEEHRRRWLMPNYDFWFDRGSGAWKDARRRAIQRDTPFTDKIPKVVWRGNRNFNPMRPKLLELTDGKDWADVKNVDWTAESQVNRIHQDTYCNFAMTVNTEGITYSGRLKYLLNCNSLTLVHDLEWKTYWYHLLESEGPNQNYVKVSRDWEDLEEKVHYYLDHPDEAQTIINNSIATFRSKYLTRAAESCYTRYLIQGYASVAYTPEVYKPDKPGSVKRLRGITLEQYMSDFHDFNEADLRDGEEL